MGMVGVHETLLQCGACKVSYGSDDLLRLVPHRSKFCYDVIVYVGTSMFLKHRNEREIKDELQSRGVNVSASQVYYIARKFILYLAIAHRESSTELRNHMNASGGYILHLDATCDGDSPHLMTGLDGISEFVLENVKIPSEKAEKIVPFLMELQHRYGTPKALVHDMGKGILKAVGQVFPHVPDYICHFHFLRDIGKDLFGKENDTIRNQLKKHAIQSLLRKRLTSLKRNIEKDPVGMARLTDALTMETSEQEGGEQAPAASLYTLILWALDGKKQGNGYGFPFDRPYLTFYGRLESMYLIMRNMKQKMQAGEKTLYHNILREVARVIRDTKLKGAAAKAREKCKVFDKLRNAMRIALPSGKHGLKDRGTGETIASIESRVTAFYEWLSRHNEKSKNDYRTMLTQIEKYWEKLFADPILVETPDGAITLLPQRTNNILEHFFRDIKRSHCRKSGCSAMGTTLKAMLSDTPLVKNLNNPAYMEILLQGKANLEERFAEIDVQKVRRELIKNDLGSHTVHPAVVRFIKKSDFPDAFAAIFLG